MAVGLLQAHTRQEGEKWRIESAGIWLLGNYPAAKNTLSVLASRGIDLSAHRSHLVSEELIREFNLVLTMERGHKEALKVAFPPCAGRIYMLSEMVGESGDIADPIGRSLDDFEQTALELEQIIVQGSDRIRQLAGSSSLGADSAQ
jgi:protein-tyrosine-phosphatase